MPPRRISYTTLGIYFVSFYCLFRVFLIMAPSEPRINASGLKPFETKGLPERQAQPHESAIIQSIKEMYSCSPTETTFDVYANDSQFHDPIGIANGRDSIRAQFVGLAKVDAIIAHHRLCSFSVHRFSRKLKFRNSAYLRIQRLYPPVPFSLTKM
ncbi:hypothetical protein PTI98_000893 [Pleurotus ostreatus]|nr:hypothetical protein PTI98_000893 [Pleurotus ostreatus]